MNRTLLLSGLAALLFPAAGWAQMQVVSTSPTLNAMAPVTTTISITFDRQVDVPSVTVSSFRVYGQWSGPAEGSFSFQNGNQTVTLTPTNPLSAGEMVFVNLSHDLRGTDLVALRSAGYAFQFLTATAPSSANFSEIDRFSNRSGGPSGPQTRIYGASAADLNNDGFLDLATINEVSADVRVFLNRADGSGLFDSMLSPVGIGVEASPNAPADFNNDGRVDLCVAAAESEEVSILLGAGNGTFSSVVNIPIGTGTEPHGIQPLDVDGDGDLDVVNCNVGSNNLSLLINNGSGVFSAPTFFEGGVNGEYGLAAADMNADGITDLVVAGRNGEELVTMLGNGNGTFTAAGPAQSTGGSTWVVVLGDVNGDGDLDAATANDGSGTVGILLGNGDGTFAAVSTITIGSHVPAVDLGDLDGDGDLDLVVSSFGGRFWQWFSNDGSGAFTFENQFDATDNPSCAVLFDFDNDNDLDMALTDEIADEVVLMKNGGAAPALCSPVPSGACRTPIEAGKSKIILKHTGDLADRVVWKLTKGKATPKSDFADPLNGDGYALCIYEDNTLIRGLSIPAGSARWKDTPKGFSYHDKSQTPDGVLAAKLLEGLADGDTKIKLKAKGANVALPDVDLLNGVLRVQLRRNDGTICWGAVFSPPYKKQTGGFLKADSDGASAPAPLWSAIQAQVVGPTCGGCHGFSAGLTGLGNCNTGYASLVGVASTELPIMNRVEPGDPTMSWIMQKLDGTQDDFTAQCSGMFCGQSMPLASPLLAPEVRDAIRTWISNGALNDCP